MFQWGQTPLSYPCIRAIKTATFLVVQNCPGTGLCLRIRYSHVIYHPSVRTKHHHKERIKNFFYLSPHILFCVAFWSFAVQEKTKYTQVYFTASFPTSLQFGWVTWHHNIPISHFRQGLLDGSLVKGVLFCLATCWIFMALLYYASIGFPDL